MGVAVQLRPGARVAGIQIMRLDSSNLARVDAACNSVAATMDSAAFRGRFSDVRLLRAAHEIEGAREQLPAALLPFMVETRSSGTDVYALDLQDEHAGRVVAWCDHAVVADRPSFEAFTGWLRGDPSDS